MCNLNNPHNPIRLAQKCGLFHASTDASRPLDFYHSTFREFLAAKFLLLCEKEVFRETVAKIGLTNETSGTNLRAFLVSEKWWHVYRLCVGKKESEPSSEPSKGYAWLWKKFFHVLESCAFFKHPDHMNIGNNPNALAETILEVTALITLIALITLNI